MGQATATIGRLVRLFIFASAMVGRSEECMSTTTASSQAVVAVTTTTTTTTTAIPCACPAGFCGFIFDNSAATTASIVQMQLQSVGSCACAAGLSEGCYAAQPNADTTQPGDSLLADLACPTPASFCICDVTGECFTSILGDSLSDILLIPFQDAGGCFVYAQPFCFTGGFNQNDGLIGTRGTRLTCAQGNGVIGSNSVYIKAFSASCSGCGAISAATPATCTASTFVAAGKKK